MSPTDRQPARVFIDDSDGGRYVECPDALADHLDHLERRAHGAELALVKCQRELAEALKPKGKAGAP